MKWFMLNMLMLLSVESYVIKRNKCCVTDSIKSFSFGMHSSVLNQMGSNLV